MVISLKTTDMKRYIIPLMLTSMVLMTVRCTKEEFIDGTGNASGETVTITVKSDRTDTRTYLDTETGAVCWEDGDLVWINGSSYYVIPDPDDPTTASVPGVEAAGSYLAAYSSYDPVVENDSLLIQTDVFKFFDNGSFDQYDNLMVAYSESTELQFKNLMGIVRIGITGNGQLNRITFISNDGAPLSGYLSIPVDDIMSGNLRNYSDFSSLYYSYMNTTFRFKDNPVTLDTGIPTYLHMVVPARTYEDGFTVVIEDSEGNVCTQSTGKSVTVNRSEIVPMSDFEFTPNSEISISVNAAGATASSIPYTIIAEPGTHITTTVVTESLWNTFLGQNPDLTQEDLAGYILASYYNTADYIHQVDSTGTCELTATFAFNSGGNISELAASSSYVIISGYSDGTAAWGNAVWEFATTAAASGDAPDLNVQFIETGKPHSIIQTRITTSGASDIHCLAVTADSYTRMQDEGMDDRSILLDLGTSVGPEYVEDANTKGFDWYWTGLRENTGYKVLIMAIGEGGMETIEVLDHTTDPYLPSDGQWETISSDGYMECGLLSVFFGDPFPMTGLVIEKYGDYDIFRITDPFAFIAESYPDMFSKTEGRLTIDARNGYVVLDKGQNYAGLIYSALYPDDPYGLSFCSMTDFNGSGSYGVYDESAGTIDFGDIALVVSDYEPGGYATLPTKLWLHTPTDAARSSAAGLSVKPATSGTLQGKISRTDTYRPER